MPISGFVLLFGKKVKLKADNTRDMLHFGMGSLGGSYRFNFPKNHRSQQNPWLNALIVHDCFSLLRLGSWTRIYLESASMIPVESKNSKGGRQNFQRIFKKSLNRRTKLPVESEIGSGLFVRKTCAWNLWTKLICGSHSFLPAIGNKKQSRGNHEELLVTSC